MRISNKTLYALLCDIETELEILRDKIDDLKHPHNVKDLDKPKRKPGRPRKNA